MKRIALDTNITISALFWTSYPRTVYNLVRERRVTLLSSIEIEAELIRVLSYPKFGLASAEILPIINNLRRYVHFVEVKTRVDLIAQDPTDNIFLHYALDGKADYIISGDRHLLDIGNYEGIQITKARDFLIKEGFI